ncbi:MAG: hypothetical protein IJM82_06080 [Synergistaceae bacterium]|nr:hypothetical protein [Synergistaceae bacterium]MBQ7068717.1 hypothetical protein [Synergistaceae bacterium]MBR0075004.1 hypothetical protein [Synergistaceae bacterium]MBR0253195.1 hypothetical protein [Synergistaceae bacterium]MBR0317538.1 hypothetical protein [Synergistaceae bacterium]
MKPILRAEILTSKINEALTGTSYSQNLEAIETEPIFWRTENLPACLICSQSGQISGNPSVSGSFNVTVTAENSAGSVSKIFNMTVSNNDNAAGNGGNEGETDNSTQNIEGQAEENSAENNNQQSTGNQAESHDISNAPQNNNNTGSGSNSGGGGCESFNLRPLLLFFIIKCLGCDNKKELIV